MCERFRLVPRRVAPELNLVDETHIERLVLGTELAHSLDPLHLRLQSSPMWWLA